MGLTSVEGLEVGGLRVAVGDSRQVAVASRRVAIGTDKAPQEYREIFELAEQNNHFSQALELAGLRHRLGPYSTARMLFGSRAHKSTISNWIAGRYAPPQWAVDAVQEEIAKQNAAAAAIASKAKAGPGRKAGARNIMAYMARR